MKHHLLPITLFISQLFTLTACQGCITYRENTATPSAVAAETDDSTRENSTTTDEPDDTFATDRLTYDDTEAEETTYRTEYHQTGFVPYRNARNLSGTGNNEIMVDARSSNCDYVVLVKKRGRLVANVYISKGDSRTVRLPNGTYQVYFYAGTTWSPDIQVKDQQGGFTDGLFSKDEKPVELYGARMTYKLYGVEHGNFSPSQTTADEAL